MRTVTIYQRPPADALTCLPEPGAPESLAADGAQDADAFTYESEARRAGADCRAKVLWLKNWADGLPN